MTRIRLTAAIGAAFVLVAVALLTWSVDDPAARAVVSPRVGYRATVLGWSSWYGSYDLGAAGTGWCIDHGLAAPDPAFRYVAVTAGDVDADRRAAIAWIVSSHGGTSDPVDAAAVMLAIHDLRGATYPFGVMDVDRLTTRDLAGFGGHEADVIVRARATKAAGLAHQGPRAPFHLALHLTVTGVGTGRATAIVTDAVGHAVDGALVRVTASGATVDSSDWAVSAADGSITRSYRSADVASPAHFDAEASIPDPALSVVASSTVRAQRVARPAWLAIRGAADLAPAPTTTSTPPTTVAPTTTIVPTTTTTAPSTTTTGPRPTTTTVPTSTTIPASTTTTTRPTTSTTGGSVTPTTGATTTTELAPLVPLAPVPAGPPTGPASLPLTGGRTAAWALLGLGLVAIGGALVAVGRRRRGLTLTGPTGTLGLRATRRATRRSS